MPKINEENRIGRSFLNSGVRDEAGKTVPQEKDIIRQKGWQRLKDAERELAELSNNVLGEPAHLVATAECDAVAVVATPDKDNFTLQGQGENHALPVFTQSRIVKRIDTDEVVHSDKGAEEMTHDGKYGHQIEIVTADHKPDGSRISPIEFAKALEILPQLITYKATEDPKTKGIYKLSRIDFSSVPFRGFMDQANACQFNVNLEGESGKNLFDNGSGCESALHLIFAEEMLEFQASGGLLIFTPNESGFARLKRHGPTEPDGQFVGVRKGLGNFPTLFLRGPNRDVARQEDPRAHKHIDKGGVRTEVRAGSPECVTMVPEQSPSLVIETIMRVMIRAIKRYDAMPESERARLSAESLWNTPRRPFPANHEDLLKQFKNSSFITENYPELKEYALSIIEPKLGKPAINR